MIGRSKKRRVLRPSIQLALELVVLINLGLIGSIEYIDNIFWGIIQVAIMMGIMFGAYKILEKYGREENN